MGECRTILEALKRGNVLPDEWRFSDYWMSSNFCRRTEYFFFELFDALSALNIRRDLQKTALQLVLACCFPRTNSVLRWHPYDSLELLFPIKHTTLDVESLLHRSSGTWPCSQCLLRIMRDPHTSHKGRELSETSSRLSHSVIPPAGTSRVLYSKCFHRSRILHQPSISPNWCLRCYSLVALYTTYLN